MWREILEEESWGRYHGRGIMDRSHGVITEEDSWRGNRGGGIIRDSWRRNQGRGVIEEHSGGSIKEGSGRRNRGGNLREASEMSRAHLEASGTSWKASGRCLGGI